MHNSNARTLFLSCALLALSSCGGDVIKSNSQQPSSSEFQKITFPIATAEMLQQKVSIDVDHSAIQGGEVLPGTSDQPSESNLVEGWMKVTNLATGEIEFFLRTVNIEDSEMENYQSFQAVVLKPGNYAFELSVSKDDQSYSGSTIYNLNEGDAEWVSMTIRPALSGTFVDSNMLAELIDYSKLLRFRHL